MLPASCWNQAAQQEQRPRTATLWHNNHQQQTRYATTVQPSSQLLLLVNIKTPLELSCCLLSSS